MRQLDIQEMQQASLSVLIQFDEICKSEKFDYFLGWGTLIGAVRHKGFIPWDDDLDVLMPRADYDRFRNYMQGKYNGNLKLCSRKNTENYFYGIPRLSNLDYVYISEIKNEKKFELGAFIDIYPIDNYGNDKMIAKHIRDNVEKRNNFYLYSLNPAWGGFCWKVPIKFIIGKIFRLVKGKEWNKRIDDDIYSYVKNHIDSDGQYIGVAVWGDSYGKYLWEKEWFEDSVQMEFEGQLFPAPKGYHELLTFIYGDYMQLPPEEKRIPHHDYKLYIRD